jgi:hypothetical protein
MCIERMNIPRTPARLPAVRAWDFLDSTDLIVADVLFQHVNEIGLCMLMRLTHSTNMDQ